MDRYGLRSRERWTCHVHCSCRKPIASCASSIISFARLYLAEREYGGSQLDWLLQKDQMARLELNGLRVRNQILRVSWRYDLIVLCSNQQRRSLDSRGVLANVHTDVNPDGRRSRPPVSRSNKVFSDSVLGWVRQVQTKKQDLGHLPA